MCLPPHPQQQQFNKFYSENVKIKKQSVLTRNLLVTIRTLCMVEVTGLEPAASCSQSKRATTCATPRTTVLILSYKKKSVK